ncbi:MAG: response regulator [Desulfobacteraceae bacterium]|nr:MAG: response regulator [Desulfobacteraceae bacterium]
MHSQRDVLVAATVLVVDDDAALHRMMKRIFARQPDIVIVCTAESRKVPSIIHEVSPDLIVLDLHMPDLNGYEVAQTIKEYTTANNVPMLMFSGLDLPENRVKALEMGIDDFIPKAATPEEIIARLRSHLRKKRVQDEQKRTLNTLRMDIQAKTSQLSSAADKLHTAALEVIFRLTTASEYRDNETGAHIQRMSHYAAAIASAMGFNEKVVQNILHAAPMHDIGKIGIPDRILLKPGKLDDREWQLMRMHPLIGANILKNSSIPFVRLGEIVALTHHEKWDGSGYPRGLKGKQIPLAGRIVALADVFDALTSKRPYKEAFPIEKSIHIIAQERGMHFDPAVVDAFFSIQEEVQRIKNTYGDVNQRPS